MLNASYLVALNFKKRTKLFPHPFFGLSLCSAVAASCSRCAAQQPALIATRLLDEPQLCNTENQADHEKKKVCIFLFPCYRLIHSAQAQSSSICSQSGSERVHEWRSQNHRKKRVVRCCIYCQRPHGGQGAAFFPGRHYLKAALNALPMISLRTSLVPAPIS